MITQFPKKFNTTNPIEQAKTIKNYFFFETKKELCKKITKKYTAKLLIFQHFQPFLPFQLPNSGTFFNNYYRYTKKEDTFKNIFLKNILFHIAWKAVIVRG